MKDAGLFLVVFGGIFLAAIASLAAGRHVGLRAFRSRDANRRPAGLGSVETVAFGLLGLLFAFTFSGAADRLDTRRRQIVDEANAIGTAWLRLDLLPAAAQPPVREAFRRYSDERIATYRTFSSEGVDAAMAHFKASTAIQSEIWTQTVAAVRDLPPAIVTVLPALNEMFDLASTRMAATEMHPPAIIYIVLGVLSLICGFLIGYNMAASSFQSWPHVVVFAALVALTLTVILDFEYPRLGLIRIDDFDQLLVQVRTSMG